MPRNLQPAPGVTGVSRFALAVLVLLAPGCGGGSGGGVTPPPPPPPGPNPLPTITAVTPSPVMAGSPEATITVTGTGFVSASVVRFAGKDRSTDFVSSTQLRAHLLAADLTFASTWNVTVFTPAPGGGESLPAGLVIANPLPAISGFTPAFLPAGSTDSVITVNGSGFAPQSLVTLAAPGQNLTRASEFISPTQLKVWLRSADLAGSATLALSVGNPSPGGGASGGAPLEVRAAPPVLTAITPNFAPVGGGSATLVIDGSGFVANSLVLVNGFRRTLRVVSPTRIEGFLGGPDLVAAGVYEVHVETPPPGGGVSGSASFEVRNPVPVVSALSPASMPAGSGHTVVGVTGSGFQPNSVVLVDGSPRFSEVLGSVQINVGLTAADLASPRTLTLTVSTPTPGGGVSNATTFTVTP